MRTAWCVLGPCRGRVAVDRQLPWGGFRAAAAQTEIVIAVLAQAPPGFPPIHRRQRRRCLVSRRWRHISGAGRSGARCGNSTIFLYAASSGESSCVLRNRDRRNWPKAVCPDI
jgi:hypothetical protein